MHHVAILAFPGVVPFDLATPVEVFGRVRTTDGAPAYEVRVCGTSETVDAGIMGIRAPFGLDGLECADTVMVPGTDDLDRPVPPPLLDALRAAAARGSRVASICSGAFLLAAAGLLDGRTATTHWAACAELARRYPAIRVDPGVLYIDEGQVLTSAGAAAGLDLCLHMVRRDLGALVAGEAARLSVVPLERAGGQAQFIVRPPVSEPGGPLDALLLWIEEHLDQDLSAAVLARRVAMSTRTFARRFREQTGDSAASWVTRSRLHRAQILLETTDLSVEEIAARVGFGAASTLRERFAAQVGTSPGAWRRSFRGPAGR